LRLLHEDQLFDASGAEERKVFLLVYDFAGMHVARTQAKDTGWLACTESGSVLIDTHSTGPEPANGS
jgi:hypothetical protein